MNDIYIEPSLELESGEKILYALHKPAGGWRRKFPYDYYVKIKPIAEVLSVLDGADVEDWISYLQEADAVYRLLPDQQNDWSWIRRQTNSSTKDLWEKILTIENLKDTK